MRRNWRHSAPWLQGDSEMQIRRLHHWQFIANCEHVKNFQIAQLNSHPKSKTMRISRVSRALVSQWRKSLKQHLTTNNYQLNETAHTSCSFPPPPPSFLLTQWYFNVSSSPREMTEGWLSHARGSGRLWVGKRLVITTTKTLARWTHKRWIRWGPCGGDVTRNSRFHRRLVTGSRMLRMKN